MNNSLIIVTPNISRTEHKPFPHHGVKEYSSNTPTPLASLSLNNNAFELVISPWLIALVVILAIAFFAFRWWKGSWRGSDFEIDKAEVGLGSGKISFKPNLKDQEIAYKIWVELSTRKIGLPIDLKHDVVQEIYDSWHNFFSITRELIKDIPVSKVKNKSTQQIIRLSIDVLNEGLRPHLTSWQARFRHWYENELEKKAEDDIDPQYIQAKYPNFKDLEKDLLVVNAKLIRYREKMRELILGDSGVVTTNSEPQNPILE